MAAPGKRRFEPMFSKYACGLKLAPSFAYLDKRTT